ncbi:MAG: ferritin family protein [Candidatus Omnitrophota bacterium]
MKIDDTPKGFIITDFNELDAYSIACKIEKDGIWFYSRLIDKIDNKEAKKTLNFLIDEERKHLAFFENRLFEIRARSREDDKNKDLLGSIDYKIFYPYKDMKYLEVEIDKGIIALGLGLIVEDKSIKFYKACKNAVSSQKTKEELQNIIEEEDRHKYFLQSMLHTFRQGEEESNTE